MDPIDDPEVTETRYVGAGQGPREDTETFYKRTPPPGGREDFPGGAAPTSPKTPTLAKEPGWLRRDRESVPPPAAPSSGPPWAMIAVGALGAVLFLGVLIVMLAALFIAGGNGDAAVQEQPETFKGLKVKKGLK